MLSINGKKFMNLPEAVQWLLNNNALPFQSTASFAPDTEIAKSTIINPAPAEIKIGSLVLFADGKFGTVSAITSNGFKVGQDATDLADGVPHITDIQIDASNHLIITMSEGDPIDAGLIKEVSSMSIDASQHLIVTYNDGTTNDLGPIFQGNVNIAGNFTADSIIENMSGYSFTKAGAGVDIDREYVYAGIVKNGNKLTGVLALNITRLTSVGSNKWLGSFIVPQAVADKLFPVTIGGYDFLDIKDVNAVLSLGTSKKISCALIKSGTTINIDATSGSLNDLDLNDKYYARIEFTFLLSNNLAS